MRTTPNLRVLARAQSASAPLTALVSADIAWFVTVSGAVVVDKR
jgi:hypothetical protein